jgi:hypothetical protein
VAFVPGINRWVTRTSQSFNYLRLMSFVVAGLGFLGYRWLSRGGRIDRKAALATIAGA